MTTAPADPQGMSDAELIASVRAGKLECYGTLYERHVAAAYNLARQLARTPMEADDLVSEAFSKVLDTLRGGKGPDSAFRAYLLTAVRHGAYDKTRKDKRVDLAEDMTAVGGAGAEALTVPFSDTAVAGLERTLAAKAFARLPERWQAVLWHTEIEQQSPAEVAPLLGLTPNGVSALAYRAREGLRQAYLQVHLAEVSASRCRATADRLGAWTRDGLSKRERAQVEQHLDECDDCQALAAELADVNGALRAVVAPLVLGGGVLGYLALSGAGKAGAATAVGAGAAAGSAGGAANAAASAPRQFVGVAASGVAMAAAVAVALTAGGGTPHIPVAVAPAPPAAQAPAVPGPAAPVPAPPAPQPAPPAPAPAPAPAPGPQPAPAPAPEPPAAPAPAPAPAPANVTAEAPADGVALEAGGDPVELPITVRNDGGTTSDPVTVTLNLPDGVTALGAAGGGGSAPTGGGGAPAGAARQAGPSERIDCPGGSGTVTCATSEGLAPGESATLVFRLRALPHAQSAEITGSINSGSPVEVSLRVPVSVAPAPEDDITLVLDRHFGHSVVVTVRNNGETTGTATLRSDRWAHAVWLDRRLDCGHGLGTPLSCETTEPLEPGESVRVFVVVPARPGQAQDVTFTATLGDASDSGTVRFPCWPLCLPEEDDEPDVPPIVPPTTGGGTPTTTAPAGTTPSEPSDTATPSTGRPSTEHPPTQRPWGEWPRPEPGSVVPTPTAPGVFRPEPPHRPAPPTVTEPSRTRPNPPWHHPGRGHGAPRFD